ncbi:prenyltransferase/squalene oxidase repeat-containing protein (plasmid) [Streptomyces olivoreticuli]|uniref:prenyltransferase/squalene oxidase repeat-containing protein n=1 Tax=Streptomyces olivoreticuli TaxID=68246 RepID=UPI00265A9A5E|nr:prenyltransferase/squalene oxidase repeat-containing protein [Streptomyces olivoreticuli]WKK27817.1 prenyltransferase/squalene oxidase repeat-containing protein [Streptomyces olivoreticuli]
MHKPIEQEVLERVEGLVGGLGTCSMQSSAYPTAWAARLRDERGRPVFPDALEWLRRHQHTDGSWGGSVPAAQDRFLSTLAAVTALRNGPGPWVQDAVRAGITYLNGHPDPWAGGQDDMLAFELVAPPLAAEARELGLQLPLRIVDALSDVRKRKLAKVPAGVVTTHQTPLLHALETLTDMIPVQAVAELASQDGSIVSSTVPTGVYWQATGDPAALDFLRKAAGSTGDGGLPEHYPIDVMEPAWVLYALGRAGMNSATMRKQVDQLATLAAQAPHGLTAMSSNDLVDADDTAMTVTVLRMFGSEYEALQRTLLAFEGEHYFRAFAYERNPAVSANGHVLEALAPDREYFIPQVNKCKDFLLSTRREEAWWTDKWHLSLYYATAHVVPGLSQVAAETLSGTWAWLLDTQHADGSWGTGPGRPEETAWAVLALDSLAPHFGPLPDNTRHRAHQFLATFLDREDHAELWVAKALFLPPALVKSAILAAYVLTR